jgi:predicted RNA-binding protein with PUA-like domain
MALWLFKQEPECYSYADLVRDGKTVWDGVRNPVAQKNLQAAKAGDKVLYYHTGKEKAFVGVAKIIAAPKPDPGDPDGKSYVVEVVPVKSFKHPVTLAAVKADAAFAGWELVRLPRLSVMPVTQDHWDRIEEMAKTPPG